MMILPSQVEICIKRYYHDDHMIKKWSHDHYWMSCDACPYPTPNMGEADGPSTTRSFSFNVDSTVPSISA